LVGFSIYSFILVDEGVEHNKTKRPTAQQKRRTVERGKEKPSPQSLADDEDDAEDDEEPPSNETKGYTAQEKGKTVEREAEGGMQEREQKREFARQQGHTLIERESSIVDEEQLGKEWECSRGEQRREFVRHLAQQELARQLELTPSAKM